MTDQNRFYQHKRPDDCRKEKNRPFTGEEYLESLRDGREIYIYGERVKDVTTHPAFRNAAASIARLYDALHDPKSKDELCWETDTGNGGYTHKFFRYARTAEDLREQRDAIAAWSRLSYGWMGRTPDYKAAFGTSLGANADFYGPYADNAREWYKRIQESCLYFNHAIVNPPIDRNKPIDQVKDVYVKVEEELEDGIIVSGAKVVATNSALTHYNFIGFGSAQIIGSDEKFAMMFIAPMDAKGVKLICRHSYELAAGATGSPYDFPLSSRFDENDAILVLDKVFIPKENILIYKDFDRCRKWAQYAGFATLFPMQACTRLAVKLDFLSGIIHKALQCTGVIEFRGVAAQMGEVLAWRNLFWSLTDAMYGNSFSWESGCRMPSLAAIQTYRVMAPMAYLAVKKIAEQTVTSGLIYLPSHKIDFDNPDIDKYLEKYVRGSNNIEYRERIKILKLLWDAIGTEFGGRHELYEINYAGSQEEVRLQVLGQSTANGILQKCFDLVDQCLADYDENGWKVPHLTNPDDINILGDLNKFCK
ncbi:4-hydroxyphenylacetate 3-monooxygenase, oxygenase component [Gallibacterium melopsittaci]|uniref:4-hydroxyphenylacetate 3-monooxygenase, oxygenase component n=1 Tax=Gallibacterium melopsittaci TaxID=516063 RepID=A0ABV6HU75_9PAST